MQAPERQLPLEVQASPTRPEAVQSASVAPVQPAGQQPSLVIEQVETGLVVHSAVQAKALPISVSVVQALPSLQLAGQLPSHFSPASTTLLPQTGWQSTSLVVVQVDGQQPSVVIEQVVFGV
jgi:hypothetical protein